MSNASPLPKGEIIMSKLMDYFNGVSLPELKEGKHTAKLIQVTPTQTTGKDGTIMEFIRLDLQLEDRTLNDNRFEVGFPIFISQLKKQLGMENQTVVVKDFLDSLIKENTEFHIWVSFAVIDGRRRTNINYLPPLEKPNTVPETTSEEQSDEEILAELASLS